MKSGVRVGLRGAQLYFASNRCEVVSIHGIQKHNKIFRVSVEFPKCPFMVITAGRVLKGHTQSIIDNMF
jgi:hypothetical protein